MKKQYYFLVAGQVVFSVGDSEEVNNVTLNTVINYEKNIIPMALIGKAQQGLQMRLHQIMQDPDVVVRSITVLNITRLGQMSQEEFVKMPKGVAQEPVKATELQKSIHDR